MANGTIHKLGTLYVNGGKKKRPTKPWINGSSSNGAPAKGDIFEYSGSGNIEIRDTDSDDDYKLQWIEVNDKGKKLLICDRNIMTKVSWDSLNAQGFVNGKEIIIDGQKYKIRLLSGGSSVRNSGDLYSGGSPKDNEWDRIITNEGNFSGLPIPSSTDLDKTLNSTDYSSSHNKVLNWAGMYSWCKEVYSGNSTNSRVTRSYASARCLNYYSSGAMFDDVGWRPALETLNYAPIISDSDEDLGEFTSPFTKEYTINDSDGDKLNVTEKVNNEKVNFMTNLNSGSIIEFSIKNKWPELSTGKHTITIEVDDGNGGTAIRKWTFTKGNNAPTINGFDADLGESDLPITIDYSAADKDGDKLRIIEKINDKIIRTLEQQESGKFKFNTDKEWPNLQAGKHTATIEVDDYNGGKVKRTYTFTKITPNITEPIIISPEDNSRQESVFYIEFKLGKSNNGKPQYPRVEASKNSSFGPDTKVFKEIEINKEGNWISHTEEVSNEDTNYNLRIKLKIEDKNLKYFRVSSSDKTITVDSKVITLKFNNRIEFETLPQKIDFIPYSISLTDKKEIDSKATIEVYACNNALDKNKQWENITEEYKLDKPYVFINKNKENENWAISVKYKIEANDATGEISIDAIGIGVI